MLFRCSTRLNEWRWRDARSGPVVADTLNQTEQTNAVVQFAAHAFFFGGPIGWMLGRSAVVPVAVR
jgi:hypothetical protein